MPKVKKQITGQEYDAATGLNYFNARYYNPTYGRFLSQDQAFLETGNEKALKKITKNEQREFLANPQHLNSYSYAKNNPLIYVDQLGDFALRTFAAGLLQAGKTILDISSSVSQAVFAGSTLAASQWQATALLTLGSVGNLDSAFTDSSNAVKNIVGSFQDKEPARAMNQGPYRDLASNIMGDSNLFNTMATGGDLLAFAAKDVPAFLSQAVQAYKIYQNAKAAGVGLASLKFLTEKSGKIAMDAIDKIVQLSTGKSIADYAEDKIIITNDTKK